MRNKIIRLESSFIRNQNEKKFNLHLYNKLASKEEKFILKAVHQASKKGGSTAKTIATHFQKLAGKPIKLNLLIEGLNQAEKAGLIKKDIANREDEPFIVWKNQILLRI